MDLEFCVLGYIKCPAEELRLGIPFLLVIAKTKNKIDVVKLF